MSQGSFIIGRYEADSGEIHPIRIQPETITDWNSAPTGAQTNRSYFRARPSKRRYGQFARYVTLGRTVGSADGPFTSAKVTITVPVLTLDDYDDLTEGQEVSYQGVTFSVVSKTDERRR